MKILRNQANSLLRASTSYDSWLSSPYGRFINFLDKHTLAQLRQYWVQYATTKPTDPSEARIRMAIAKRSEQIGTSSFLTGLRSAGPMWSEAMDTMSHLYTIFWQTGVAGGNFEDLTALGNDAKGFVNPMFAISSAPAGDFAVHYGTEPLLGFHLAEAFVDTVGDQKNVTESAARAVRIAKTQFHDWCLSFKKYVEKEHIFINLFCGEALALCHELQVNYLRKDKGSDIARAYVKPWSSSPLILDGLIDPTPEKTCTRFDVIDTSNLGDHVGLINMLSAAAPLLRWQPSTVLYTESLLVASSSIETQLPVLLGSDVATFSLLLGLAPAGHLTGITCEAVGNESVLFNLIQHDQAVRQYRMRVPWIAPELTGPPALSVPEANNWKLLQITLEPTDLALYLFEIYKNMFSHEDVTKLMSQMRRIKDEQRSLDLQRYTRAGFVAFLRVVKRRVSTDWKQTMKILLGGIDADKSLLVGSNSLQELYTQLHLFDIFTSEALETGPRNIGGLGLALRSPNQDKGFLAQDDIPPVVHIILTVPRKKLAILTNRSPESVGTPAMHLSIRQNQGQMQYENLFYSLHCFFGKMKNFERIDSLRYEEDEHGWLGSCDLVVSCPVPAFGLLTGPRDGIRVSLRLNPTPENFMKFSSLHPTLSIHEAELNDLLIWRDQPGLSSSHALSMQQCWTEISKSEKPSTPAVRVKMSTSHLASHLQNHLDFVQGSPEGKVLAQGAEVTLIQHTPCTASLHVGKAHTYRIIYPFCVNAAQSKIRIARKSSWVEIEVPISSALNIGGDYWTQATLENDFPPYPWSIPRVNLAVQPELELPKMTKSSSWLSMFMGMSLSDAERAMQVPGRTTTPRFEFKDSLNVLFASFAGLNQNYGVVNTFQLTVNGDCHTLLFANSVRHDLDLGSIVMDAYIVPLTEPRVRQLMPALGKLTDSKVVAVKLSPGESTLWKSVLPALAERCRSWKHKPSCGYRTKGVPLSTANNKTPLCSCGEGKVHAGFHKNKLWAPFAKYATRIAIMPIFPVPYLEPLMSDAKKDLKASSAKSGDSSSSSSTEAQNRPRPIPPTGASQATECDACGRTDTSLKACTGCGKVRYCNQACQKAAWKDHKKNCAKKR